MTTESKKGLVVWLVVAIIASLIRFPTGGLAVVALFVAGVGAITFLQYLRKYKALNHPLIYLVHVRAFARGEELPTRLQVLGQLILISFGTLSLVALLFHFA